MMDFPTEYKSILERIKNINPIQYSNSRNYINGSVTYLSPYISRGVISLPQLKEAILQKFSKEQSSKLLQELAWRQYWQNVWINKGSNIFNDLRWQQANVNHHQMIKAIQEANTGIQAIDKAINELYTLGYLHNHLRMYIASISCNIAMAHWLTPSKWMYYYLLDGDLASNSLSWQWVAGAFSSKKYYCNQININNYTNSAQLNTFLDTTYDALPNLPIPQILKDQTGMNLKTNLPPKNSPILNSSLPTFIYNAYNLDPLWHYTEPANKILLLEPSHYQKYPVSEKVINFIIDLSKNINNIQIFVGEFEALFVLAKANKIFYKSHPAFTHYKGIAENYEMLFPTVTDYYPSFSAYFKKCKW